MKTASTLDSAGTHAAPDEVRKLSLAFSVNLPRPTKDVLHKNLLANSLSSKLKQHRHDFHSSSNKENVSRGTQSKSPKRSHLQKTVSYNSKTGKHLPTSPQSDSISSSAKLAKNARKDSRRIDSAPSDQLPKLARRKSSSFNPSRRSSSADPGIGRGSLHSGTARMTSASSFFHSSDSAGLVLESRGADYTIKVVKKDGVFRPADKYASSRHLPREMALGGRNIACDYELFMLPVSNENTTAASKSGSHDATPEGHRRPIKVSWSKTMGSASHEEMEASEIRVESSAHGVTPITPNNLVRTLSSASFNFKRPVYSSGKSRVKSIGLQWRVPTAPPDNDDEGHVNITGQKASQSPQKPMWSWLVTPDTKQQQQKKKKVKTVGHLSQGSKSSSSSSQSCLNRTGSTLDVRTQHSRDLHPVATAMNREGTSVSRTKWHVPSSSASTLEPERVAMDRLELVKREGKIRTDPPTANEVDDVYRILHPGEGHNLDDGDDDDDDDDDDSEDDGEIGAKRRQLGDTTTTSFGTKSNVDSLASPAKSRSTYYC